MAEIPVIPSPVPPYARVLGAESSANVIGDGSPEGVITAKPGKQYFDRLDNSLWEKKTGNGNTGWIQLVALGPDT